MKTRLLLISCVLSALAFAADATGKWTYEMPGRGGGQPMQQTITLKVDGSNLTGSVSSPRGDTDITNGKVDGDTVTFSVVREFQGNSMKINYTGKISGDTIQFKVEREGGAGRAREFTAKRASST